MDLWISLTVGLDPKLRCDEEPSRRNNTNSSTEAKTQQFIQTCKTKPDDTQGLDCTQNQIQQCVSPTTRHTSICNDRLKSRTVNTQNVLSIWLLFTDGGGTHHFLTFQERRVQKQTAVNLFSQRSQVSSDSFKYVCPILPNKSLKICNVIINHLYHVQRRPIIRFVFLNDTSGMPMSPVTEGFEQ